VPLIFWNPWDNPDEGRPSRFDLSRILAGEWDAYIDQWGRDAKAFGRPLLVSWGLEMNGDWFPWSGVFHGGGDPVPGGGAGGAALPLGPETLKAAYRHVVDRVRSAGANNIAWIFHVNNTPAPGDSWNRMAAYYPGSAYADWIAMSAYGKQFPGEGWVTVKEAILDTYPELAAVDPSKPILLAEWGVGEFPRQGSKGAWIREFFSQAKSALPRLGGMVFWHERWQNGDLSYSNLRVNSSLDSLTAFREGIADPFWLAEPRLTTVDP